MPEVIIRGVSSPEEHEKARSLIFTTFYQDDPDGFHRMHQFLNLIPDFPDDHTRILLIDNQIAACLTLFTYTIRLGESRLKMGGIGYVATAPAFRRCGYAARLMDDTLRYMAEKKYHVSTLFGIVDFYHRWGYSSVLPEYSIDIAVDEALACTAANGRERKIKAGDLSAIQRIHLKNDTGSAGSIIRFAGHYNSRWDVWKNARVLMDDQGKIVAYYLGNVYGNQYRITEAGILDGLWSGPLLHACARRGKDSFVSNLLFHLPPAHPLAASFLLYQSDHKTTVFRNRHGMMTVVDLQETLEAMVADWEYRIGNLFESALCAEVTLLIDKEAYRIRCNRGFIDVAKTTGNNKVSLNRIELIHLLTGYRYPEEILSTKKHVLPRSALLLLDALFPKRHPYIWTLDRF